jgi:hypothetical protein
MHKMETTITVIVPDTVFGTITQEFSRIETALKFIQACLENDASFTVHVE